MKKEWNWKDRNHLTMIILTLGFWGIIIWIVNNQINWENNQERFAVRGVEKLKRPKKVRMPRLRRNRPGYYIEPEDETKEDFLKRDGLEISKERFLAQTFQPTSMVCCVWRYCCPNTTVRVCYDEEELQMMQKAAQNDFGRLKFYVVTKFKIKEYMPK